MTALSTVSPRYASASAFSFWRIIALTSGGEYSLPPALTRASPFGPRTTLNGTIVSSSLTSASLRPMKRLTENTVFSGLVTAWRLATVPTRRSPLPVKATTEGVVRAPSAFSTTVGSPPSSTAMHELVVPRSMPIVLPIQVPPARDSAQKSESDGGRFLCQRPPNEWTVDRGLGPARKVSATRVLEGFGHVYLPAPSHSLLCRACRRSVRADGCRCSRSPTEAEVRGHLYGRVRPGLVRLRRRQPELGLRRAVRRRDRRQRQLGVPRRAQEERRLAARRREEGRPLRAGAGGGVALPQGHAGAEAAGRLRRHLPGAGESSGLRFGDAAVGRAREPAGVPQRHRGQGRHFDRRLPRAG